MKQVSYPLLSEVRNNRERLGDLVKETPVYQWHENSAETLFGGSTRVFLKLELLQYTGSFKPRGALTWMKSLTESALKKGVTAVSAGNHAAAVGYAAKVLGSSAKVVMPKTANPQRIALCKSFGAEVVLVDDVHAAFDVVKRIEAEESRTFIHPFEGVHVMRGTATLGLEFFQQCPDLDALVVPIGGGGLCSGVASVAKQISPRCEVFGVEPEGADSMHRSFASGKPESIDKVRTIADSLGAPHAAQQSFEVCRKFVDELVMIDDDAMCKALYLLFKEMKLAVEPAGAAATAALLGPLRNRLRGRKVGLIVCGANIDTAGFAEYLHRGELLAMS